MSRIVTGDSIITKFGYQCTLPKMCCGNCAYFDYHRCKRMYADHEFRNDDILHRDPDVDACGICTKYLSKEVVKIFMEAGSLEETQLKMQVQIGPDDKSDLSEIMDWFTPRPATAKMMNYMDRIMHSGCKGLDLVPLMPEKASVPKTTGQISQMSVSCDFRKVHHWLGENAPKYEEWSKSQGYWGRWNIGGRTCNDMTASEAMSKILKDFSMFSVDMD